jgi:hypothetical protein
MESRVKALRVCQKAGRARLMSEYALEPVGNSISVGRVEG